MSIKIILLIYFWGCEAYAQPFCTAPEKGVPGFGGRGETGIRSFLDS